MEKKTKSRDITGQVIGNWIPRRLLPERTADGEEQWDCECRYCGNLKVLRKGNIKKTKSCGCLPSSKDASQKYVGKRYNMLTGLQCTDRKDPHNGWIWEWACDCGNIVELPVKNITSKRVKSCGCLTQKNSFAFMVRSVARKLYDMDSSIIENMAKNHEKFPTWLNPVFSYEEAGVKNPVELKKDAGIYISTGYSAYDCICFIRALLRKYDLDLVEDFVYSARSTKQINDAQEGV